MFAGYGGKAFEEIFEGVAGFQIVKEILYWDAGSGKDRSPAYLFRVYFDERILHSLILALFAGRFYHFRCLSLSAVRLKSHIDARGAGTIYI